MISLLLAGTYTLAETKSHTRVLWLNEACYVWLLLPTIGDVLAHTEHDHQVNTVLSTGAFNLYDVKDEPELVDLQHLELRTGDSQWQGYLLLTGLPSRRKKRSRIIASRERITGLSMAQLKQATSDHVEQICMQRKEVI